MLIAFIDSSRRLLIDRSCMLNVARYFADRFEGCYQLSLHLVMISAIVFCSMQVTNSIDRSHSKIVAV